MYLQSVAAFVSYISAYKQHQAHYIFQLRDLDLAKLANGFCMLRVSTNIKDWVHPKSREHEKVVEQNQQGTHGLGAWCAPWHAVFHSLRNQQGTHGLGAWCAPWHAVFHSLQNQQGTHGLGAWCPPATRATRVRFPVSAFFFAFCRFSLRLLCLASIFLFEQFSERTVSFQVHVWNCVLTNDDRCLACLRSGAYPKAS